MAKKVVIVVFSSVVFLSVIVVGALIYGDNGPTFSFDAPRAIILNPLKGKIAPKRNVRFPNVLPIVQFYTEKQAQPLLSAGDDIAIVLGDDVDIMSPYMIRLNDKPVSGNVRASYFFYTTDRPLAFEVPREYNSYLRAKIIRARATAWRQTDDSGEWFWLRDYYDVEIRR